MATYDQLLIAGRESLWKIVTIAFILVLTFITARLVRKMFEKLSKKSNKIVKIEATQLSFLKHATTAIVYVLGISIAIYHIPQLRALSVSLLAGAGILAVIIGFASQQAFSNIISGVFIVIFKPYRVGDRVKLREDVSGVVEDINLRHTTIRNFENKRIVIPNSIISNEMIENFSIEDEKICKFVEIGISYDSDVNKALRIMQKEAMKHPSSLDNRTDVDKRNKEPAVPARVIGYGDSSVNLRAWVWAKDPKAAFLMGCDLNKSIKGQFDKNGIEIPFPYRTIVYKKDIK
ncbi:MAG: mechanosensitive ion channel family protein [Nanoarchaeota archaeon]|nr:mechanosensitive ion channel family protein [Nanoarchaeota archaeon]